jgi:uncharacterized protein (DUF2336 family)
MPVRIRCFRRVGPMIVRHFLQWVRTAPAAERADATAALARAYLYSELSPDDRLAAEGAMVISLDDPSPLVRRAMAEVLAAAPQAPAPVILALASDQPDIAHLVLERSPLLLDADLVELVATGADATQATIARRAGLPKPVAAAIAEVGSAEACRILLANPTAEIAAFSLGRIGERHGQLPYVREALLARNDLPATLRQALMVELARTLAAFVAERGWLDNARAARISREACEKGTVKLAGECTGPELERW